ncbi:MAG: type IV toxin-antitoxin system AbiEi family antitoxin domain-containing protein, partial [Bacilli bacterium]|nr:type IV toxin-antitoxin system AbiEi family antitoxin domain-containing protein [Bacilli bacterium]
MAKIEKFTEMLEEYEGKELATKFLIDELGITSYYIGVLTHNGVIEKVKRGIYKVKNLSKTNEKKAKPKIVINDKNNGKRKPKNSFEKFR